MHHRRWARAVAQRLPVLRSYERRVDALHRERDAARVEAEQLGRDLEQSSLERERFAAEVERYRTMWPPGHYYSPYPALDEVRARANALFGRDAFDVPGVDLRLDDQWRAFDSLPRDIDLATSATQGFRYHPDNDLFNWNDAAFLHAAVRSLAPRRLIEVGSGWSSACTLDTVERHLDWKTRCTFIEPYPTQLRGLLLAGDEGHLEILEVALQDVALDRFRALERGDVLFVDSTHVSKIGSDVNYLFFDILPSIAPGVFVHLHDVFPGFEYRRDWIEEGRAWSEQYILRAFLEYNTSWSIWLWPQLLAAADPERFARSYPSCTAYLGGSIWLRRNE